MARTAIQGELEEVGIEGGENQQGFNEKLEPKGWGVAAGSMPKGAGHCVRGRAASHKRRAASQQ